VTAAASGIGQGTVLRLAGEGARPIDCDLAEPALAKTEVILEHASTSWPTSPGSWTTTCPWATSTTSPGGGLLAVNVTGPRSGP
jgi:NAD(P)-dependent dehydrogenase (short-subunit alcohol dehydrogenase family)